MSTDIESVVSSWPGVDVGSHRFGGREFTLAGSEIGHLHGDRQADIPFAKRVRDVVVREGLTAKHHLYPESGWVTKYLRSGDDGERAVWLFRVAYLYKVGALQRRDAVPEAIEAVDVATELDAMDLPSGLREAFPAPATDESESPAANP
jgi:hypothetical protein